MKTNPFIASLSVLALASLLLIGGCAENSDLDDPDLAPIIIEKIEPSIIEADATPVGTLETLTASVTVRSTRAADSSLNDIVLDRVTVVYNPALQLATPVSSRTFDVTFLVPAGGTTVVSDVPIVSASDRNGGIPAGTSTVATVVLEGADLNENPAQADGQVSVEFLNPAATGACCTASMTCQVVSQSTCTGLGGTYQGDGVACNPCP